MGHADAAMRVELVYSPAPRQVESLVLDLAAGCTLVEALRGSGVLERNGLAIGEIRCGVWGRVQPLAHVLRDGDRVEIYRPLTVDPKEARRQRYRKQRRA